MRIVRLGPVIAGAMLLVSGAAYGQAAATKTTTRTYDCTKAGNANKAACKSAAATAKPASPAAATVTKTTTARNYDCSKPGNANKAVCKSAAAAKPVAPAKPSAPAAAPVATSATRATTVHTATTAKVTTTSAAGHNGATAQCKDGTYSKSTHRSGTCAGHKGVATWY